MIVIIDLLLSFQGQEFQIMEFAFPNVQSF